MFPFIIDHVDDAVGVTIEGDAANVIRSLNDCSATRLRRIEPVEVVVLVDIEHIRPIVSRVVWLAQF